MHDLLDQDQNRAFYEERYKSGYMDAWDARTTGRVVEFLEACGLPPDGEVLDYGCGTGVFTRVLQTVFPQAACTGADISENALARAREKESGLTFCPIQALEGRTFDLVFTHHVLEHVADLPAALAELTRLVRLGGHMVHVLPCGNAGSLEERLCADLADGRDPTLGNRFVFEDPGHIRRLTSDELAGMLRPLGFTPAHAWFRNHFWGGVDWITAWPMFRTFPDPRRARSLPARLRLSTYRLFLTAVGRLRAAGRRPPQGLSAWLGAAVDRDIAARADREWRTRRADPGGSAMYLHFIRTVPTCPTAGGGA